jgi:predicted enzyme related to lactoylglutathione lyase
MTTHGSRATNPGVNKIANIIVPVADHDRQVQFYTEVLGLQRRVDLSFGGGSRWTEVAPDAAEVSIAICPPGPGVTPGGKDTGITLQTDDIDRYHAQLWKHGADVDLGVSRYGEAPPLFWFRDPEGNRLMVVQAQ